MLLISSDKVENSLPADFENSLKDLIIRVCFSSGG